MYGYFFIRFIDFVLINKKLAYFKSLFTPYDFEKNDVIILNYFNDNKIDKTNLTDQMKLRLNEISKIKHYFNQEINQIKSSGKN